MRHTVKVFGALSDETRLRLMMAARGGERCVCELIDLVQLAPSTVSKHLSLLRDAGWVDARKEGRWVYYRLADKTPFPIIGKNTLPIFQSLEKTPVIKADAKRLKKICSGNSANLCQLMTARKEKKK